MNNIGYLLTKWYLRNPTSTHFPVFVRMKCASSLVKASLPFAVADLYAAMSVGTAHVTLQERQRIP